jgi:hypothetical protein
MSIDANSIVEFLNATWEYDPEAINRLMGMTTHCDETLANHPTIVVGAPKPNGPFRIGFIGLINGILSKAGQPKITKLVNNQSGKIVGFSVVTDEQTPET